MKLSSAAVRFSVLALLTLCLVGGASADPYDGFEDGDYSSSPVWNAGSCSGDYQVQTNDVYKGSYSLEILNTSCSGLRRLEVDRSNYPEYDSGSLKDGDVLSAWYKPSTKDYGGWFSWTNETDTNVYNPNYGFTVGATNTDWRIGGDTTVQFGDYSAGNWYKIEVELDKPNSDVDVRIKDTSGTILHSYQDKPIQIPDNWRYAVIGGYDHSLPYYWDQVQYYPVRNKKPQFNSSSVSPDPPLIGENVSYSAEVFDSDGSVQYTNLTLSYGGSQVVSDEQRTGTTSPVWNDVFTPQTIDKWLNATLEVVDDAGALTTKEINRYLSDDAPSVSIQDPGNQTYWSYGVPLTVDVSDSDSEPGESWTCTVDRDSSQVDSFTLVEGVNSSYSATVSSDLGGHTVDVTCTDGSGNTGSDSVNYSVKALEEQMIYSAAQVYETENRSFELDLKTGDMVNEVDFSLVYDGDVRDTESLSSSGVETLMSDLQHEIPLVSSNQTTKNWRINYSASVSDFQAQTTSTVNESTSQQSQEVLWSYYIESADTVPSNGRYIEKEDIVHQVDLHTETKKAELDGVTKYHRDNSTVEMVRDLVESDRTVFQGTIDSGLADSFNSSTFDVSSSMDVSFNGDTRQIQTADDQIEVYRIVLTDGNSGLNTAEALKFDINYEEEGYDAAARLTMDLSVWKTGEVTRRYQFQEDAAKTHSFHIYPSWASYNIQTKPYPEQTKFDLIQYFNPDKNYVRRSYFFPTPQTISSQTTTVPLKTINESETASIDFEITNSEGDAAENVYCRADRKFGGGDFETVFMIKTGSQGRSQSFAEVNEIYYSFTCYKDGQQIETFASQILQDPMRLQLGSSTTETVLNYYTKFDASCTGNVTSVACDYQSQTDKLDQAVLRVERKEVRSDVTVCSTSSPTATGTLTCSGLNATENRYSYSVTGEYPDSDVVGSSGFLGEKNQPFPAAGLIMTAIVFMFVTAATAFNLAVGIGSGTLTMLLLSQLNWIVLSPSQKASLLAFAIIAGVAVRQ